MFSPFLFPAARPLTCAYKHKAPSLQICHSGAEALARTRHPAVKTLHCMSHAPRHGMCLSSTSSKGSWRMRNRNGLVSYFMKLFGSGTCCIPVMRWWQNITVSYLVSSSCARFRWLEMIWEDVTSASKRRQNNDWTLWPGGTHEAVYSCKSSFFYFYFDTLPESSTCVST